MKIAAIIPARYGSSRFRGKALVKISGVPMIERVYRQVQQAGCFDREHILVATDDRRIADVVGAFGGQAVMTSPDHQSGSERLWEVMAERDFDAAINIQGDEPIIPIAIVSGLYERLAGGACDVVTPAYLNTSYNDFVSKHVVKTVLDQQSRALYFSRSPIPFTEREHFKGFYHHMGMYGYLRDALKRFVELPPSPLERIERLEQLRFLDNGIGIHVMVTHHCSVGVDVPADVDRVEKILNQKK